MERAETWLDGPELARVRALAASEGRSSSAMLRRLVVAGLSVWDRSPNGVPVGDGSGSGAAAAGVPFVEPAQVVGSMSPMDDAQPRGAEQVTACSAGGGMTAGLPVTTAARTRHRPGAASAPSAPSPERVFAPAPGRPEVCARADCGMSKYRLASGRWCP